MLVGFQLCTAEEITSDKGRNEISNTDSMYTLAAKKTIREQVESKK